ncbi:MAG: hypothetical protein M3254_07380 [Actinomycetota bacterium]|nr:hypothetical protein [Actinomycetota bacterium]
MQQEQSVSEMVEEVLERQAHYLVDRSGMDLQEARLGVASTPAGRQLKELGESKHQHEEARYWQADVWFKRASERVRQGRTA